MALFAMFLLPFAWTVPVNNTATQAEKGTEQEIRVHTVVLHEVKFTDSVEMSESPLMTAALTANTEPLKLAAVPVPTQEFFAQKEFTPEPQLASSHAQKVPTPLLPTWLSEAETWQKALAFLWFIGLAFFVGRTLIDLVKLKRLKRRVKPMRGPLAGWFAEKAAQMEISRPVVLAGSHAVASPMAIGFFRPHVLIPEYLWVHLDGDALKQVLSHELAHIRRGDDWHHLLQRFIMAALFWHPAAWFVFKQLAFERELSCDDWAVRDGKMKKYARSLVRVYERLGHIPVNESALGAAKFRSQLGRRVEHLTGVQRQRGVQVSTLPLILAVLILFGSAAGLAWKAPGPSLSQSLFAFVSSDESPQSEDDTMVAEDIAALLQESQVALRERRQELQQLAKERDQINAEIAQRREEEKQRVAELSQRRAEMEKLLNLQFHQEAAESLQQIERKQMAHAQRQAQVAEMLHQQEQKQIEASLLAQEKRLALQQLGQAYLQNDSGQSEEEFKAAEKRKIEAIEHQLEAKRRELERYEEALRKAEEKLKDLEEVQKQALRIERRSEDGKVKVFIHGPNEESWELDGDINLGDDIHIEALSDFRFEGDHDFSYEFKLKDGSSKSFYFSAPEPPTSPAAPEARTPSSRVLVLEDLDVDTIRELLPELEEVEEKDLESYITALQSGSYSRVLKNLKGLGLTGSSDDMVFVHKNKLKDVHRLHIGEDVIFAGASSGSKVMTIQDDDLVFTMRGEVAFNDDGSEIATMDTNGLLVLQIDQGRKQRAEIRSKNGTLEEKYFVNGDQVPFDPEGRDFLKLHLPNFAFYNQQFREKRIRQILNTNGVEGVLNLVERHKFTQHLEGIIYKTLVYNADLEVEHVDAIIERTTRWDSSHERSGVYRALIKNLPAEGMEQWVPSMFRGMSNHEASRLVSTLTRQDRELSPALLASLLGQVQHMDSDHELGNSLRAIARSASNYLVLQQANFATASTSIDSDYELAQLWKRLVRRFGAQTAADLAMVVDSIDSDYELGELLKTYVRAERVDLEPVWIGLKNIDSSHTKGEILNTVARTQTLSEKDQIQFLSSVKEIESSYERERALKNLNRRQALTGEAKALFQNMAQK
jgi:beta-lactamase regulating signal transducer with metallopeptidase domain